VSSTVRKEISRKKTKLAAAHKKRRQAPPRLIHRARKDLELKDYLMEDHPELGLPVESGKLAKVDGVLRQQEPRTQRGRSNLCWYET
jgi:hypothetical protein